MPDIDITTAAPGVERHECFWGYYLYGTREALIAAGLAKPEWFPDWTERTKRGFIVRSKSFTIEGSRHQVTRPAVGKKCSIRVEYAGHEAEKKQAEWDKRVEEEREAEALARGPKTTEEFHKESDELALRLMGTLLFAIGWAAPDRQRCEAFAFDDASIEEVRQHMITIMGLLENGRIIKLRDPSNPKRMRAVGGAQMDAGFQRFLQRATGERLPCVSHSRK